MEGSGLSTFISSITTALAEFSTTTLGTVLVAALGITVGLVIAWFAYRFITKRVAKAMRKGSL